MSKSTKVIFILWLLTVLFVASSFYSKEAARSTYRITQDNGRIEQTQYYWCYSDFNNQMVFCMNDQPKGDTSQEVDAIYYHVYKLEKVKSGWRK